MWGFMICGTTHTHASPLLLHVLLNSSCLPCASPTELSARWVLSSSHQIPNKRSLLYGSDTGSTQGSPQRDRDRENEIRVWTQIEEKEVASSSSRSNRACGVRPHNRCLDLLRRACVRACMRWGLLFATMMIAAQLLATHFSSTAANHAQANARILWFVSLSSLPLFCFINMLKPYTPIIHYLCADDGSRWMLSCLLLQFGLFASAGLLALFCLQQDVVCAFQSPIAAAASFVVLHQGGKEGGGGQIALEELG